MTRIPFESMAQTLPLSSPDRAQRSLRLVIARQDLGEALKIVRVLLGQRPACHREKRGRIDANGGQRVRDDCLMPGRIPGMHEKLICVLVS